MRLVTNFKHVVLIDQSETGGSRLQIIESKSHITVGRKDKGFETIVCILNTLLVKHDFKSLKDFFIIKLGKSDNSAT